MLSIMCHNYCASIICFDIFYLIIWIICLEFKIYRWIYIVSYFRVVNPSSFHGQSSSKQDDGKQGADEIDSDEHEVSSRTCWYYINWYCERLRKISDEDEKKQW